MKTKSRKSCTVTVGRWASYAIAGAATAFAASNDAEGAILYSGQIDTLIGGGGGSKLGTLKTLISNSSAGTRKIGRMTHNTGATPSFPPPPEKAFLARFRPGPTVGQTSNHAHARGTLKSGNGYASNLAAGVLISAGHFNTTARKINAMANFVGTVNGASDGRGGVAHGNRQWATFDITGFLGFEFNLGAGEQYGWARITMSGNYKYDMTLVDYAYGTPGQAIMAGEEVAPVPEPATLGMLALGALGLFAARRAAVEREVREAVKQ